MMFGDAPDDVRPKATGSGSGGLAGAHDRSCRSDDGHTQLHKSISLPASDRARAPASLISYPPKQQHDQAYGRSICRRRHGAAHRETVGET